MIAIRLGFFCAHHEYTDNVIELFDNILVNCIVLK